jgi:membrane-associated protease RseP (regulator of RpoE activity)
LSAPIRLLLQIGLFLATLVTCASAGARLHANFSQGRPAVVLDGSLASLLLPSFNLSDLTTGLPFALALLLILGAHEFGHYWTATRSRLNASLPYFLPAPPLIGTFGAFIRIRSIVYSRKVLFDVGVAGPLAGFAALVPVLLAGMAMSKVSPGIALQGDLVFGTPLLIRLMESLFFPGVPSSDIYLHPVARAAWVGLFATALNLLPIGQLDGGHILYALFGERHRTLSKITLAVLIPLGYFYPAWWVWGVALYWLGRRHPFIFDGEPIGTSRRWMAGLAAVIFVLSFMPAPILNG